MSEPQMTADYADVADNTEDDADNPDCADSYLFSGPDSGGDKVVKGKEVRITTHKLNIK